jgi:very-short-patch-repair endonuclease
MGKKLTNEEFVLRANKVFNNKYNYSKIDYKGSKQKIIITCIIHGEFLQIPSDHLNNHGCPKCAVNRRPQSLPKLGSQFIKDANIIHNNKYNYSNFIYTNAKTKSIISCIIHGDFLQSPNDHLCNHGCPKCGLNISKNNRKWLAEKEFILKANKIHNNVYDYSQSQYTNSNKNIIIICKKHGKFKQQPNNHLNGTGCPICNSSKGELRISRYFMNNKIKYVSQKTFNDCKNPKTNYKLRFDFYIPSKNLLIEYDGQQHFITRKIGSHYITPIELKKIHCRDKIKTEYAKQHGIKLLRIKYTQLSKIEEILKNNGVGT